MGQIYNSYSRKVSCALNLLSTFELYVTCNQEVTWLKCPPCVFVDKLFSFSLDWVLVKVPRVPTHRVMCPHADCE